MEEKNDQIDERLAEGLKVLKTQKLLPNVGHTFLIADSTPVYNESKRDLIYLPQSVSKMLGIKMRVGEELHSNTSKVFLIYCALFIAVVISGLYPVLLNSVDGTILERLFGKNLINLAALVPISIAELRRKVTREMFPLSDALNGKTLLTCYINSIWLTGWSLFFGYSLIYTDVFTTLYCSSTVLFFWVLAKISKKHSTGLSEFEINGAIIFIVGSLAIWFWNFFDNPAHDLKTTLFQSSSLLGVLFGFLSGISAARFLITNYELAFYLPSYTNFTLITFFTLLNVTICSLLQYLLPGQLLAPGFLPVTGTRILCSHPTYLQLTCLLLAILDLRTHHSLRHLRLAAYASEVP